jgi:hypothetical protein
VRERQAPAVQAETRDGSPRKLVREGLEHVLIHKDVIVPPLRLLIGLGSGR